MNNVVAIICVAIAVVGTWVLLSPQVETLRPAMSTPGAGAAAAPRSAASPSVSAFSSAPVDGGPAAGFRVGDSDILIDGPNGWASVFTAPTSDQAEAVFPRSIDAEVAPLDFDVNCLLLTTDGVSKPIANNETVAASYSAGLVSPLSEVAFDQLMSFPLEEARDDRTAVAVWFSAPPA